MVEPTRDVQIGSSPDNPKRPTIIGLYGVSGCGKTYQLRQLQRYLPEDSIMFYDGSEMIDRCAPGGLEAFKAMEEEAQLHWREAAVQKIYEETMSSGKAAIVAGHHMLWSEDDGAPQVVCTSKDWMTYTHIVYMDASAELVMWRRQSDATRTRPSLAIDQIRSWQCKERESLRFLCRLHKIQFIAVPADEEKFVLLTLITHWTKESESKNLIEAKKRLDEAIKSRIENIETILVFDADKTLAPEDSGELFFNESQQLNGAHNQLSPLKSVFASSFGYSFNGFCQATLLYEESVPSDAKFEAICSTVSSKLTMYAEIVAFLQQAARIKHIGIVVMTCGLRTIWEKVLHRVGLSQTIAVIGGGRLADRLVVTPDVKSALVNHLRDVHQKRVCAFGDSPLDLPMLKAADMATVVVGELKTRSKSMESALKEAIDKDGLRVRQLLLPKTVSMRLNASILPPTTLSSPKFLGMLLARKDQQTGMRLVHATRSTAAKLLATPTRDSELQGPALRRAHLNVGWYLAVNFLCDLIGLEGFGMQHTQGTTTEGQRLLGESRTLIVALMRGGEPMAFGVNEAFPCARFLHASKPEDVTQSLVSETCTIVLVDSVINSGKTVIQFVRRVRQLDVGLRIFVVTGVAHSKAVAPGGIIDRAVGRDGSLCLVALRLSDNHYVGRGATDTGNRLFNTMHIE